jgi:SH3-like domain-containing protein
VNEWAGLSAGALWTTFGLLALRQLRPALAPALRLWTRLAAVATVLGSVALALAATAQSPRRTVIVTAREATVRITPNDEARSAFAVNDGAELRVLDRKDDWLQVTDGDARRFGWLKRTQVAAPL